MAKVSGMGVKVALRPRSEGGTVGVMFGEVEVGGVDISNRVAAVAFNREADGLATLRLTLYLTDEDTIDLQVPEADVITRTTLKRHGDLLVAEAKGRSARRYLDRAAAPMPHG